MAMCKDVWNLSVNFLTWNEKLLEDFEQKSDIDLIYLLPRSHWLAVLKVD